MPACGDIPEEMANAIASGSATRPTVTPAIRSAVKVGSEYCRSARNDAGTNLELADRVWGTNYCRRHAPREQRKSARSSGPQPRGTANPARITVPGANETSAKY